MTHNLSQVEIMNQTERSAKTQTAFKLFDKNKDGFITRQEFLKVGTDENPNISL